MVGATLLSVISQHMLNRRRCYRFWKHIAARCGRSSMGATSSTMETDASLFARNNYRLSLDLWRWCAGADVRFIYASSASTYGDGAMGFDDDGSKQALAMLRPLNLYGRSKHLFDWRVAGLVDLATLTGMLIYDLTVFE